MIDGYMRKPLASRQQWKERGMEGRNEVAIGGKRNGGKERGNELGGKEGRM
jgi:hypothetical protein